jgi:hypothetical protein
MDLAAERQSIDMEEDKLERLAESLRSFEERFGDDLKVLQDTGARLEEIESELRRFNEGLEATAESVADARGAAEDLFFKAANRLLAGAREAWGPDMAAAAPEARERILALDSFFADEQKRIEERHLSDAQAMLVDRDGAMAQNALDYLRSSGSGAVAVVVGYAHLPGMAEQLSQRQLAFLGGGLSGNDEYELWESRAWEDRRSATSTVFTSPEGLKEVSRFLDETWVSETSALISKVRGISLPATMSTSVDIGKQRVLHVGKHLADQRVNVGEHVVARGPLPDKPGAYFEVYDRDRAKELVSELSGDAVQFAYAFDGESGYRLVTSQGVQSLAEFKKAPPSAGSDYVLLFHEPDTVERSGVAVSELWDSLRPAGAGGSGQPPRAGRGGVAGAPEEPGSAGGARGGEGQAGGRPGAGHAGHGGGEEPPGGGPWYQAGFFGEARPDNKGFFRTNNPRRAAGNIAALRRQSVRPVEVTFREHPTSLNDIPYTPRDGENAGLVVLLARNEAEFRLAVKEAATARKLENKQVALITCGDAFSETRALRENILDGGALIVWTPDRQLSEAAGRTLMSQVRALLDQAGTEGRSFRDMDELINEAIGRLRREQPDNSELKPLTNSSTWATMRRPARQRPS